jgi:hypothetical protein
MAKLSSKSTTTPVIKVVASKSCPSLSGKCTIGYKLGLDPEGNLHVRLHQNSGGGFFNHDWIPAQALVDALTEADTGESVTSMALAPLFRGRSANSPAFFAAVLRSEGALLPYRKTSRYHLLGDLAAFLQAGNVAFQVSGRNPRKKKASKKKKVSSRGAAKSPSQGSPAK